MAKSRPLIIAGTRVKLGETRDLRLKVSETYFGDPVTLPLRVFRGPKPGPTVFVTAAVHGDEMNGIGIIRELTYRHPPRLTRGTLICLPVVNIYGFERHERYLPDRRDLNRSFPGLAGGTLASRIARTIMDEIVSKCDYGIDLHSAAEQRTNFPNVRGDVRNPDVRRIARAFGCELVVDGKGPDGSLRREACKAGCPTIILEAGEVQKIEPIVVEIGVNGIRNVLIDLGMLDGRAVEPIYQTIVRQTRWVRAELGGLLRFRVSLGEVVERGQPIASNETLFGDVQSVLLAPTDGIVLSIATNPAVKPGEPVCHLAVPSRRIGSIRKAIDNADAEDLALRMRRELDPGIIEHNEARPT